MKPRPITTFTEHNIVHVNPIICSDEVLIRIGSPSSSTTPYDVYARFMHESAVQCFARAKIDAEVHTCHRRINRIAWGTGPEGQRRFGDDMMPPEIMAIVKVENKEAAESAWETFTFRKYGVNKPYCLGHHMWWDGSSWKTGNTWPMVMANAAAIASALRLPFARIDRVMKRARRDKLVETVTA